MITQYEAERERYESRLRAWRDASARIDDAFADGKAAGRAEAQAKGEATVLISMIRTLEQLLGQPESSHDHLANLSLEQLNQIAQDFRKRLIKAP